jgi:hypothetical protein
VARERERDRRESDPDGRDHGAHAETRDRATVAGDRLLEAHDVSVAMIPAPTVKTVKMAAAFVH